MGVPYGGLCFVTYNGANVTYLGRNVIYKVAA